MTQIKIYKATVIETSGSDKILLSTDLPDPYYPFTGVLQLKMGAARDTGAAYVREHFGIEPTVIERLPDTFLPKYRDRS